MAKTELHYARIQKKETERKSHISEVRGKFQTALEQFQKEELQILESEKAYDPSEITVAEILSTEPTGQLSEENLNDTSQTSKSRTVESLEDSSEQSNDPMLDLTKLNENRPLKRQSQNESKLAKISAIRSLIYQLAGDQQISDEYLIEIIYSKVKSSVRKLCIFAFSFILLSL